MTAQAAQSAGDRLVLPPASRDFKSPSGRYTFTVKSDDGWQTKHAIVQLHDTSVTGTTLLWQTTLPHAHGPRHALVFDDGSVVLIDEWINVASRYALMLLAKDGAELALYGFDDLVRVLGVSRRTVAAHGKLGVWMSSLPAFSKESNALIFATAGRKLTLRLNDGALSASD